MCAAGPRVEGAGRSVLEAGVVNALAPPLVPSALRGVLKDAEDAHLVRAHVLVAHRVRNPAGVRLSSPDHAYPMCARTQRRRLPARPVEQRVADALPRDSCGAGDTCDAGIEPVGGAADASEPTRAVYLTRGGSAATIWVLLRGSAGRI